MLLALRSGDRESSLIQNGGLSAACCSTSHCVWFLVVFSFSLCLVSRCVQFLIVFSFSLCLLIGLAESAALPVSSLDQLRYLLIRQNDNA